MERSKQNVILIVIAFFLIVFSLIIQTVNVKLNYTLQAEQTKLNKLRDDNKILFLSIETANDLKEISRKAEEELGMSFPKKIEYIYE